MTKKIYRDKDTGQFASEQDEEERPDKITEETLTIANKEVVELLRDIKEHFNDRVDLYIRLIKLLEKIEGE